MKYCKKCVMSDQRPGLIIEEDGVCTACKHAEAKKNTSWKEREKQLQSLADKYRDSNGDYYDCIIAASGGKDSYFQTGVFKEKLGMHPLIVSVNNYSWTETGKHNWDNLLNEFGVDSILYTLSPQACKLMFAKGLEKGVPTWYFDRAIYSIPLTIAVRMNIPLVIYGENINYEYGGMHVEETPSALDQISNDVVKPIPMQDWLGDGITKKDFAPCTYPSQADIKRVGLNPVYLSYYMPWSGFENMDYARRYGFRTLDDTNEWKREGFIEQYDQIDTVGYLVHTWFKFVKFGHFRTTDVASNWIREGRITREFAVETVLKNDWKLDRKMLYDFLSYIGYSEKQFWDIVDRFANKDIVEKRDGDWRLKKNVADALKKGGEVE